MEFQLGQKKFSLLFLPPVWYNEFLQLVEHDSYFAGQQKVSGNSFIAISQLKGARVVRAADGQTDRD